MAAGAALYDHIPDILASLAFHITPLKYCLSIRSTCKQLLPLPRPTIKPATHAHIQPNFLQENRYPQAFRS